MMSMVDLVTIGVETLRIDNGCSFEKEFHWIDQYESLSDIMHNCQ